MNLRELYVAHWLKTVMLLLFLVATTSVNSTEIDTVKERTEISHVSMPIYSKETNKAFDDVVEDLLVIIGEHNFRLNQHARIGRAIAERNKTSFPLATVLHFCNLSYAKELLEVAPDYLLRMPCRISIRQKKDNSNVIEVWLLPEDDKRTFDFAKKINTILKNIVTYGAT